MKNRWIIVALGLLLLGGVLAYSMYHKPHSDMLSVKPDYEISALTLYEQYLHEETESDEKFLGKVLQVSGNVGELLEEDTHKTVVFNTDDPLSAVSAELDFATIHPAFENLKRGENVVLKCVCTGKLMDVNLDRCVIMENIKI